MSKFVSIIIGSGHLVTEHDVQYRTCDESLLSTIDKFTTILESCVDDDHDGNYLVYDGKRSVFIRSGMATMGMVRRWKEHITSSMLVSHDMRSNIFYSLYPIEDCAI